MHKLDITKPLVLSDGRAASILGHGQHGYEVTVEGTSGSYWFDAQGNPYTVTMARLGNVTLQNAAPETDSWALQKIVVGLRQLATESVAIDAGAHSDRINGFAAELADAIGFKEASVDLLAAREAVAARITAMAKNHNGDVILADCHGRPLVADDATAVVAKLRAGRLDDSQGVANALDDIATGRRLEREAADRQRVADMAAAPTQTRTVPERLTITIDGPQGSGKTALGQKLAREFPKNCRGLFQRGELMLDARIIEIRDGRPFDVIADEFVDA